MGGTHARPFVLQSTYLALFLPTRVDTLMVRDTFRMMICSLVAQDPLKGPVLFLTFVPLTLLHQCRFLWRA